MGNTVLAIKNLFSSLVINLKLHFKRSLIVLILFLALPVVIFGFTQVFKNPLSKVQSDKFELVESSPQDQNVVNPIIEPMMVFSKPINASDVGKHFRITPSVSGKWHVEKNGQAVYFSSGKIADKRLPLNFDYHTIYTITVDKDLRSVDGHRLEKNISIEFKTMRNPLFPLKPEKKLYVSKVNTPLAVNLIKQAWEENISTQIYSELSKPVSVIVEKSNKDQILDYFSYKDDNRTFYKLKNQASSSQKNRFLVSMQAKENLYSLQIEGSAFPAPGLYLVTIETPKASEEFFVDIVSNHITQVFEESGNTHVWVSDSNQGQAINGIKAELYNVQDSPKLVDTIITGEDGFAKSPSTKKNVDFVITYRGDEIAITNTNSYRTTRTPADTLESFSYSDRPVYRPGDTVHYKAIIRRRENGRYIIPQEKFYTKTVFDYNDIYSKDNYKEVNVDRDGSINFDFKLQGSVVNVSPYIVLASKKGDKFTVINSFYPIVESYRKPDMDISANTIEKEYTSSDSARFTITGNTNYGQPLANVSFSYRVILNSFTEIEDRTTEGIEEIVSGYYGGGKDLISGQARFDSRGKATINFSTTLPGKFEESQIATLEVTPEIGAAPSIGKIAKLIHRGEFALFLKGLTGSLDKGINGSVEVLNHKIPREAVGNLPLTISLYEYSSSADRNNQKLLMTQSITADVNGKANFFFDKKDRGSYEVVVRGQDNRGNTVTARLLVFVGRASYYRPDLTVDSIALSTEKTSYKLGETASIQATASFIVNQAVVIISASDGSSSKILSIKRDIVNSRNWNIGIPITDEYGGRFGVDVFTIDSGAVISSHIDVDVDKSNKKIRTEINFDKQKYNPGDTVVVKITTKDSQGNALSSDNSLSVIDASVLQVGQLNQEIFPTFYSSPPSSYIASFDSTTGIWTNQDGGGGGGCFLLGTQILMADGSTKNIEDVKEGDKILTRLSDWSSRLVEDTVTKTFHHIVTDYIEINHRMNVTPIHRIFLNGNWRMAKETKIGDKLLDENGQEITVRSIKTHSGQFHVYNLTTLTYHTFFAEGLYVHNDKGVGPRQNFSDTVYWNPHVRTDRNGEATVSFKLPDNLTTFTAQAFSNTIDSFGQVTNSFLTHKDFNIIPAISNFYYKGDKPVISALIQNATETPTSISITLTIKEINFKQSKKTNVGSQGFASVEFPVDVGTEKDKLSFLLEVKNESGKTLDSLAVEKPILPRGNIVSSWISFKGSRKLTFSSSYPGLDFNKVSVSIVPNIANKIFNPEFYLEYDPSIKVGKKLYSYSYLLARTRDGFISPTLYDYASLRNRFLEQVDVMLRQRSGDYWVARYGNNVFTTITLWIANGLDQAKSLKMLSQIRNLDQVIADAKRVIKENLRYSERTSMYLSDDDKITRQWILREQIKDSSYNNSPTSLAISVLNGDITALAKLRSKKTTTADDRYFWQSNSADDKIFPVLAMIEKGSAEDAEKAVKGLSFAPTGTDLDLYIGIKYAERNRLKVDRPKVQFKANDEDQRGSQSEDYQVNTSFGLKNYKDEKLTVDVKTEGQIPIYTAIVHSDFSDKLHTQTPNDSILGFLRNPLAQDTTSHAKEVNLNLMRVYKDINTGQDISSIEQGKAGIVALIADHNFKFPSSQDYYNNKFSYIMLDALSPGFLYLDQQSLNSPQYRNVISRIFPGPTEYDYVYNPPTNFSDEAVFFVGDLRKKNPQIIFPYVVYRIAKGEYFQPKTSIVFPSLGVITREQ